MKISDLIKKLEILKEKHGDSELRFTAQDYYSTYGDSMSLTLNVGDNGNPHDWFGTSTNDGLTTINFYLNKDSEGKKPKITFRK